MVQVQIHGEATRLYPEGTTWETIAKAWEDPETPITGVESGHQFHELSARVMSER